MMQCFLNRLQQLDREGVAHTVSLWWPGDADFAPTYKEVKVVRRELSDLCVWLEPLGGGIGYEQYVNLRYVQRATIQEY